MYKKRCIIKYIKLNVLGSLVVNLELDKELEFYLYFVKIKLF